MAAECLRDCRVIAPSGRVSRFVVVGSWFTRHKLRHGNHRYDLFRWNSSLNEGVPLNVVNANEFVCQAEADPLLEPKNTENKAGCSSKLGHISFRNRVMDVENQFASEYAGYKTSENEHVPLIMNMDNVDARLNEETRAGNKCEPQECELG